MALHILDDAVWAKVQELVSHADIVAAEVESRKQHTKTDADLATVERAMEDVERRQRGLVANLALLDADSAALVRQQLAGLAAQRRSLDNQRAEIVR